MKNVLAILSLALAVSACSGESAAPAPAATPAPAAAAAPTPAPAPAPAAAADPKAEADTIFAQRCTTCHGADGKGETDTAKALNPRPRNYTDAEWQKSVTDEYLAKVIVEGGGAVGKSPLMAANADLAGKPEVVKFLVAKVRSFGGAAPAAPADGAAAPAPAAPAAK